MRIKRLALLIMILMPIIGQAGTPLWSFTPLTSTTASVPLNGSATINYIVTNKSSRLHTLTMMPIDGVIQVTLGSGACSNNFMLPTASGSSSCILSLQAIGNQLNRNIQGGPMVCQQGSTTQCYQPSFANILRITKTAAIPLPSNCASTGDNNIACQFSSNYGFTNMTYALCRSAQCDYDGVQTTVSCSCQLIDANQGAYSASVSPNDYNASKPVGNTVTSTYSMVNSSNETPTNCPSGPFANCFGAPCIVSGNTVTCACPVVTSTYIAPESNCTLTNKIWSATSTASFPDIESSMLFIYNTFFGGTIPS